MTSTLINAYHIAQRDEIAAEYSARGFVVEVDATLGNLPLRFDAIARGINPDSLFIIELVNALRFPEDQAARVSQLKELPDQFPHAVEYPAHHRSPGVRS